MYIEADYNSLDDERAATETNKNDSILNDSSLEPDDLMVEIGYFFEFLLTL